MALVKEVNEEEKHLVESPLKKDDQTECESSKDSEDEKLEPEDQTKSAKFRYPQSFISQFSK